MPLETYKEVRPYSAAIREQTKLRKMPPWFADPCCGHFSNDPSLSPTEIETIARWVDAGAPEGHPENLPVKTWNSGWQIKQPDAVLEMGTSKVLSATGDIPYQ